MNSKQNTLNRVSQIMIYTTLATWVSVNQFSFCEGVIIYRIMIIYTHLCSNPVLFNYVNEDSRFFIC